MGTKCALCVKGFVNTNLRNKTTPLKIVPALEGEAFALGWPLTGPSPVTRPHLPTQKLWPWARRNKAIALGPTASYLCPPDFRPCRTVLDRFGALPVCARPISLAQSRKGLKSDFRPCQKSSTHILNLDLNSDALNPKPSDSPTILMILMLPTSYSCYQNSKLL